MPGEKSRPKAPDVIAYLKESALTAWPQGKAADAIRLEQLHALRDEELAKPLLARDYGASSAPTARSRTRCARSTPGAPSWRPPRASSRTSTRARRSSTRAPSRWCGGGIYETAFLASFLSNFPDATQAPQVALALGDAYSRLGNRTEAVTQYLAASKYGPDSSEGKRARAGLRNLAPSLKELAALQQIADQNSDPELKRLATSAWTRSSSPTTTSRTAPSTCAATPPASTSRR